MATSAVPANFGGFTTPPPVAIGARGMPNWGVTRSGDLGNLATRPAFAAAVREEIFNSFRLVQSGVIQRDQRLDASARGPRVEVPLIKPFVPVSETIKSNSTWGANGKGFLTPQKLNAEQFIVPISHRAFAAGADELSEIITGLDPMAEIGAYIVTGVQRLETLRLLSLMEGALGGPLSDHVLDISRTGAGTTTEANRLSAPTLMRAKSLLGERGGTLRTISMHSHLANELAALGMLTFSTSAMAQGGNIAWGGGGVGIGNNEVGQMAGFTVLVDDMMAPTIDPVNGDKYPVYMYGPGVVRQGIQRDFRVRYGENILSFENVLAADWHGGMGIMGVSWNSPSDNPEDDDLADPANWSLAYDDSRLVPLVKIIVNASFTANP